MQKRALTVHFQRAVTGDGPPVVMEVAINPLKSPSAPGQDATLVTREAQDVLLNNEITSVTFQLVPTDHPDLTERVPYRIAWREKYMGRQYTSDFVMPDFDVDFDDLQDLGNIIGGETYIQWSDRGVPGGVAGLNNAGQVTDADGNPVSGAESAAIVQGNLDNEVIARQQAVNFLRQYFLDYAQDQIAQVYSSFSANLTAIVAQLQNADTTEKAQRLAAVATANAAILALRNYTDNEIAILNETIDQFNAQFVNKADLIGGKIPTEQLPDISLGKAVPAANQAAMLALTSSQVQPGDFAVRPDGVWFLNALPVSVLGNWIQFTVAASVFTVNGQSGVVVLNAASVGARSISAPIPLEDVTGLVTSLQGKASTATTNTLNGRITAIENDATIVKRVGGLIVRADMPVDSLFVNLDNLVTKKDGTVLNTGGGGALDIEDVEGLTEALNAKLEATHPSVTNARTPVAHKASHAIGGTDVLTPADIGARASATPIPVGDITGLQTILTNNNLTSLSNMGGRVSGLETRVEDLELGGGGGGSGASGKTVWYSDVGPTTDFSTVEIRSPFGFDGADYYYEPTGADPAEAVWPYISENGHLLFRTRNEANPVDPAMATQTSLDALSDIVDTKAAQTALDATNATVSTKASSAALATLQGEVDLKATIAALNSTNDAVALKASQAGVDALTITVGTKASQDSLDDLTAVVGTKAAQDDFDDLEDRVSATETGKADKVSGLVPIAQIPQLPITRIDGLTAALAAKADLVTGIVPLTQLPSYPTSKVIGLDAALGLKADLVGGKIPTDQIPAQAFHTVVSVANRPAMLALTTGQVQPGDVAVITATVDKGSYILNATDPSVFTNWVRLQAPDDLVQSVNGFSGTVVLSSSDVGARSSATSIPQADITGLVTALASKADAITVTAALATKTTETDVQTILSASSIMKQRADLVATSAVGTLSGQQSVDGVLTPIGSVVLLTAQSSSVSNGLYTVATGAWTRVGDMITGSYLVKGTAVVVTSGANNSSTVWQETNSSGVVGTSANNWVKILTGGAPPVYTAINGVQKIGNEFSGKVVAGGGIQAIAGGLQLDPDVAVRKYAAAVPSGSAVVPITHNLNTRDIHVSVIEVETGAIPALGVQVTGLNTISLEFGFAPVTGQYRVVVTG